jgi:hypothetical protein
MNKEGFIMKKIGVLLISLLVFLSLTGCGGGGGDAKTGDSSNPAKSEASDKAEEAAPSIEEQYNTIREDFAEIKTALLNGKISVEDIENITGISRTVRADDVEESGKSSYQCEFGYGFDYTAYIYFSSYTSSTAVDPDRNPMISIELRCPDDFYENSELDLSGVTGEEFESAVKRGLKVSAVNKYAGGEGFQSKYSLYKGDFEVQSIIWADGKGNYIRAPISGSSDELLDHTLSYVSYHLNQ